MLRRLLRTPRVDTEVGVSIPIGCLVPFVVMLVLAVGLLIGTRLQAGGGPGPDRAVVRVIDDGAGGQVVATQVVPLH